MHNIDYWNNYYSNLRTPSLPSQFCVFVANELPKIQHIVEFGCGNGRDSFYFSELGRNVIAVDASESAIKSCQEFSKKKRHSVRFIASDITDANLAKKINSILPSEVNELIIYARFFMHAIDEEAEIEFFKTVSEIVHGKVGHIFLEFRTERDALQLKETAEHYRRYISIPHFLKRMADMGYTCDYLVEGFGMAKFGHDDAHVARVLLHSS